ncbi:MAG: BTAD domain-containing putative transcriptional regulator, partial [Candidatus Promineifilaceae bacterium]
MTKVLKLALLGPLHITIDDEPLIGLDSGKAQALLCYLAVNGHLGMRNAVEQLGGGRAHSRHALANLLWGELPESDARRNLRGELLKLRRQVEPYLQISHQSVGLNPDAEVWVDTAVFQQTIRAGEKEGGDWQTAVSLYRGEFLQEFYIRQAPDFDNWLNEQRSFFHNQALTAHHAWASQLLAQGDLADGLRVARQLLTLEPTREASHRLLMALLASDGQRTAALHQFAQCQQILAAELGVDVAGETAVLHEQIRSGNYDKETRRQGDKVKEVTLSPGHPAMSSSPTPSPVHTFTRSPFIAGPPITEPSHFFGRERELKRLGTMLRQRPLQNAAIIGPRRSGKTSLLHYLRLADWLPQASDTRWIFIDFQDARLGRQETLLRTLLTEMELAVPEPCHLESFMDVVSDNLVRPTVILFDELGVALTRYPELDDAFWESLRSLATNQVDGNLGFVLASAQPPDVLAQHQGMGSPFFNIFGYTAVLGPLSEEGARNLIATSPIKF